MFASQMSIGGERMAKTEVWARIGTGLYVAWGLLHLQAAWGVYTLARAMAPGMVSGRLLQSAWNLLAFSLAAILVAVALNWRNDARGWLANLAVVSVADIGFVAFVLAPGYVPLWPGLAGPLLWIAAAWASTAGRPWRRRAPGA